MKILTKISLYLMNIFCFVITVSFLMHFQQIQWLWYGFFICLILFLSFVIFIKNKKIRGMGVLFIWIGLLSVCRDIFWYNGFHIGKELFISITPLFFGANILIDE